MTVVIAREDESGFLEYAKRLWTRRWLVVLVTLVAIVGALGYSAATKKVYKATADLLLAPQLPTAVLQANNSANPAIPIDAPSALQVIESSQVAAIARRSVPNAPSTTATSVGTTNVVAVSVQSKDARLAARAATAYANAYITYERQQTASSLEAASSILQGKLAAIQAAINTVSNEIANVTSAGEGTELATTQGTLELEASALQNDISTYTTFATYQGVESGQLITPAPVPTKPVKPRPALYTVLGGLIGLILGIGIALLLEVIASERAKGTPQPRPGGRHVREHTEPAGVH